MTKAAFRRRLTTLAWVATRPISALAGDPADIPGSLAARSGRCPAATEKGAHQLVFFQRLELGGSVLGRWKVVVPTVAALLAGTSAPVLAAPGGLDTPTAAGLHTGAYSCMASGSFDLSTGASGIPVFDLSGTGTCSVGSGPTYQMGFSGGGRDIGVLAPCQFEVAAGSPPLVEVVPPSVDVTVSLSKGSQSYQLGQTWNSVGSPVNPVQAAYPVYAATISPSGTVLAVPAGIPSGSCYSPYSNMGHYPLEFRISFPAG